MSELADALSNEAANGGAAPVDVPVEGTASDSGEANSSPASPEKPLTLREQLNKSVETVRKDEATRARDTEGKFTKPETSAAEKPAAAEIPKPEQNAQAADSTPASPPSAWAKIWDSLPPEAKAIAVKRESDVEKGINEYRGKTAQLTEISQVFEPIRHILQQNGIQSDVQAVKVLAQWENGFRNPQTRDQSFRELAKRYEFDLNSLVQNPSQPSTAQDIPESLRPVIDQFGNVQNDVNSVKQELQTLRSERVEETLRTFAKDKPHFDKVRELMGKLMNAGVADDLEGAYQKATQLHPEVSAAIKAEETAKAAAELAKTNAEKSARARQAAISPGQRSPNGAPAEASAKSKGSSARESILASIAELREGQRA